MHFLHLARRLSFTTQMEWQDDE